MSKNKVKRQSLSNRLVHWSVAISIILLILSGLGQLPLYQRYFVDRLPTGEWWIQYFNTLNLHYIAAFVLIFAAFYHIVYHAVQKQFDILPKKGDLKQSYLIIKAMILRKPEPESDKYLAEQRVAYAFIGINVLVLIITGLIKMAKNSATIIISNDLLFWSTMIHNVSTVLLILGIIGHMAAFIFKDNRKMLPGIFTGYVDEDYAKHRHSIWYKRLKKNK